MRYLTIIAGAIGALVVASALALPPRRTHALQSSLQGTPLAAANPTDYAGPWSQAISGDAMSMPVALFGTDRYGAPDTTYHIWSQWSGGYTQMPMTFPYIGNYVFTVVATQLNLSTDTLGPVVQLRIDNQPIQVNSELAWSRTVTASSPNWPASPNWQNLVYNTYVTAGPHQVEIGFLNPASTSNKYAIIRSLTAANDTTTPFPPAEPAGARDPTVQP